MKTTRFGATIALGLAAGLALSACGSSGAQTGDSTSGAGPTQVSMLLDWAPNPDHAALYAAQHTGAYDDAGLSVSFATPSNTADAAREVSLGRVDLAISYEPDTLIAVESGLDVISVAALIPTSLTSLITRADSGITSAADLGGKTIGLSGLASQEPTIDFIARNAGVDPATISLPNVQQSLNQALLTDQVDAIFGAFRNIEGVELAAQGDFVILPATELGVPDYAELVIIANPQAPTTRRCSPRWSRRRWPCCRPTVSDVSPPTTGRPTPSGCTTTGCSRARSTARRPLPTTTYPERRTTIVLP